MRSSKAAFWVILAPALIAAAACSDVGDSSAVPPVDASATGDDSTIADDGGATTEAGASAPDTGPTLDDSPTTGPDDAGANAPDVTSVDAGQDAGEEDAGLDATALDGSGGLDSGSADAGGFDAGAGDAGGFADAGGANDAGVLADAGSDAAKSGNGDAGTDAGPLVACTSAGQTGCVKCQYNNGSDGSHPNTDQVCTPMEAVLVQHDIAAGTATAPGPDPDEGCYSCAAAEGCLDDSEFNDTDHECEDLSGASNVAACETTLGCILQASCSATDVTLCYCGTAPLSGTCANVGASNGANGACKADEASGLGLASNDGLDILKNFTSTTLPAGVANNFFQCAISNGCPACLH